MARNYRAEYQRRLEAAARRQGVSLEKARQTPGFARRAIGVTRPRELSQAASDHFLLRNPWVPASPEQVERALDKAQSMKVYYNDILFGLRAAQDAVDSAEKPSGSYEPEKPYIIGTTDGLALETAWGAMIPSNSPRPPDTRRRAPAALHDPLSLLSTLRFLILLPSLALYHLADPARPRLRSAALKRFQTLQPYIRNRS